VTVRPTLIYRFVIPTKVVTQSTTCEGRVGVVDYWALKVFR
jgi:hypothetical protein